jgi:hypothetical protein
MKTADFYRKTANYWQAVLRVGLPVIVIYRACHLFFFWLAGGKPSGASYPWRFAVIVDPLAVFIVATVWWSAVRSVFGKGNPTNIDNQGR